MRAVYASLAIGASLLLADCSGGGSASTPLPLTRSGSVPSTTPPTVSKAPKGATGKVLVRLTIPCSKARSASFLKKPTFVSPSTASVQFKDSLAGSDGTTETDTTVAVTSSSLGCSETTSSLTCTITLNAPLGNNTFAVYAFDANGKLVASNEGVNTATGPLPLAAITVVAGQSNLLTITLSGSPQSYSLTQAHLLHGGAASSVDLGFTAYDADGNLIGQPHPNTFADFTINDDGSGSSSGLPGTEILPVNDFAHSYSPAFSGLYLNSSTSSALCSPGCLQLENPGDLTISYDGGAVYHDDGTQQETQSIASLQLAGDIFTPLIDFGYSLSPNVVRFASDTSAAQTVSISGVNVLGVELLENAENGAPCGNATASRSGSTITVSPAPGMPASCVLAVNRRYQGTSGSSVPVYSAIPVNVGASTTIADGTESTADLSFASSGAAPQTLVITPATGFTGSVSPAAYKCWSPTFSSPSGTTYRSNEVPLSSVASITPASGQSINGSPVVFTVSPIASGVCAMQTPGLAGNDPLGFVIAVGF